MKNTKTVGLAAVVLAAVFTNGTEFLLQAANTNFFTHSGSPYSFVQALPATNRPAALSLVSRVLATPAAVRSVPAFSPAVSGFSGAFWSLQNSNLPPVPGDFFPDLPVYTLDASNRLFLIDDRSVDYQALGRQLAAENLNIPAPATDLVIDTNSLWLEVPTNALPGSNLFNVVIHNTSEGEGYDVLTKTDLTLPLWTVETNIIGAAGDATPVTLSQNERTNLFVWARSAVIPIYTQPLPQMVWEGDSVTFSVVAGGVGLSYQWTCNGTNIYGATGSSYTINNVLYNQAGDYRVIITSAAGSVTSQAANLTVDLPSGVSFAVGLEGPRQDYTFRSGWTYYIYNPVQLYGKTTIEGGAIIKFDYSQPDATLQVMGSLNCQNTPYYPAVLTSMDDDSEGAHIYYSTGNPQPVITGIPYLDLSSAGNVSLNNLRFDYADMAVAAPFGGRVDLWDCQFYDCDSALVNEGGGVDSLHNVLAAWCGDVVNAGTNGFELEAEQLTGTCITCGMRGRHPTG
jgi:hypothetical protein